MPGSEGSQCAYCGPSRTGAGFDRLRSATATKIISPAAAAHALRQRQDTGPVTADAISFATARHNAIRSMTWTQITAATSLATLAAAADAASRPALHTLITTGTRQRHSEREQKARLSFPHTSATKKTVTGIPQITRFALTKT